MDLWFAALLGLIQGLTEFLPISSTAHLRIAPAVLGQADPGAAFSAVIQLGTLVAVVGYFARELFVDMPRALVRDPRSNEARLPLYLVVGTIPIVVAGLGLKDFVTDEARSLYVVAGALAAWGGVMWVADRRGRCDRGMSALRWIDVGLIGSAQALALIPGVSRSGATIAVALFLGLRRPDAARFSFLLGVPAIAGAGLYEMRDAVSALGNDAWAPIAVGTLVAAVSGYASIAWLLRYLGRRGIGAFAAYRIALGVVVAALSFAGVLEAAS